MTVLVWLGIVLAWNVLGVAVGALVVRSYLENKDG